MKKQIAAGVLSLSMVLTPTIPVWAQTPVVVAQDQTTEFTFATTITTAAKAEQAAPNVPECESKTATSITLKPLSEGTTGKQAEYARVEGTADLVWQESNVFEGLTAATEYNFVARYKADANHNASPASPVATITTAAKAEQAAPNVPECESKTATSITLKPLSEGTTGKQAEYARFEGTADLVWQESNVFEGLTAATEYNFVARYKADANHNASPASPVATITTAAKAEQAAPNVPECESKTATSITLKPLSEGTTGKQAEYARVEGTADLVWQESNVFEGLTAATEYNFVARYKADANHNASPASPVATITTAAKAEQAAPNVPECESKTATSITLKPLSEGTTGKQAEYARVEGTADLVWQESNVFEGLTAATEYNFVARYKADANHNASPASPVATITTAAKAEQAAPNVPECESKTATSITLKPLSEGTTGKQAEYARVEGTADLVWQESNVFEGLTAATEYNFVARYKADANHNASPASPVATITTAAKAEQAAPNVPECESKTATSITLKPLSEGTTGKQAEYARVEGTADLVWQESNVFEGLTAATEYNFVARYKADANHNASPASPVATITTAAKAEQAAPNVPECESKTATSITLKPLSEGTTGKQAEYARVEGTADLVWQESNVFEGLTAATEYNFVARYKADANHNASPASPVATITTAAKAEQAAPNVPECESKTATSITLKPLSEGTTGKQAEYARVEGTADLVWQESNVFEGLTAATEYNFVARYKADANHNASPASPVATITTAAKAEQAAPNVPECESKTATSITLKPLSEGTTGKQAEYARVEGTADLVWQESNVFEGLTAATEYNFVARYKADANHNASPASPVATITTAAKAEQAAPNVPECESKTATSITLKPLSEGTTGKQAEYARVEGTADLVWQESNVFEGLTAATEYNFVARYKADANHNASPASPVATITTAAKAEQAAPNVPECESKTATSITLKPLSEGTTGKQAEYARVEGTADLVWQESNVFEGLTAATEYNFVARYKADANHNASPASPVATITTAAKAEQAAPNVPECESKTATSITLKPLSEGTTGKQAEYARFEGTADLVWQESNVFEGLTAATEYNFVARYKADANHNASPASPVATITTAAKAEQAAPNVPECESKTATSITLKPLSEGTTGKQAEYARVEGTADLVWQESNVFEGLTAATEYNFVARYKADANHNASPASPVATITTAAKAEQAAPNVPECESKTATSITLKPLSEGTTGKQAEYARVEGTADLVWQESNVFSDLTPNTKYAFVVRYAATAELNASPASAPLEVTTAKRSTSYGGGGGAAASDYVISVVKSDNGSLSVSQPSASAGTTITVTATADKGYKVSAVTATDANGNKLSVKSAGTDKYTFIMPTGKVSVKASFVQEGVNTDAIIMQIGSKTIQAYGKTITNDASPLIVNNRTMVPIRVVTETLGGTAVWNEAARTVTLVINGKTITMTIDVTLERYGVAPIIINNRTYVPIRFVAEELGADVQWNETTQQITITK